MKRLPAPGRVGGVVGVVALVILSSVAVRLPGEEVLADGTTSRSETAVAGPGEPVTGAGDAAAAGGPTAGRAAGGTGGGAVTGGGTAGAVQPSAPGLSCEPGRNGGATDEGVTATRISLASTVVLSGVGASFLSDSPKAMQAVVQRVNREGGICGRLLDLTVRDDGWKPDQGLLFLRNFIESRDYFALPVVPSSEGLTAAIKAGEISRSGIPVVGSDGMLIEQYQDPWVWPVATATVSTMRIMARHGYDLGARTFGIVYDSQYKFGVEGAKAFEEFVKSLPGAKVRASVGIPPGQSSYGTAVQRFNADCNPCDMVAMLLEPATAETWIAGRPVKGKVLTSGAQTLFNRRFAQNCRSACQGMLVWTGYNPPIDALASLPGVAAYVNDVRAIDPGMDVSNAFAQGAYLGMTVFVEALKQVGPEVTRERLRAVLDSMDMQTDLAAPLSWRADRRHANVRAQAFSLQYAGDSFSGFRNEQTGWIADPDLEG